MNKQKDAWNQAYKVESDVNGVTFPSEYVIRMFKGSYPKCDLSKLCGGFQSKSILDISCGGIGRDIIVFKQVGFEHIAATEITQDIVNEVKIQCNRMGIDVDARVGNNRQLPFHDGEFDFVLSWNVCYYFDHIMDFSSHVKEYARVLKPGGVLVFSIPKASCFIYKNCILQGNGLVKITSDPFNVRNGIILKRFDGEGDIEATFGTHFKDFTFGSINDDCFGLDYSWHIGYCIKK